MSAKQTILDGKAALGIEFGSTRIKGVLIDGNNQPIAQGDHEWENKLDGKIWTYSLDDIWNGLRDCYANVVKDVQAKYGTGIKNLSAIGFSGMMHGYMAFDKDGEQLVPFRTWRNTLQGESAAQLSELFGFNIPQRWSIAHLYQAILNDESHIRDIAHFTTLAGYIHWKLTGRKVLGIGEASGVFPIDSETKQYDKAMVAKFEELIAPRNLGWKLSDIIPDILSAGEVAGELTAEGAKLLDPTGELQAGIRFCPPEGDAGTGMVATNAVKQRTGNVSAGTSCFGMIVLEKALSKPYEIIDMVTTPDGSPVAMIHCNNCTSDLNAWIGLFKEFYELMGQKADIGDIFTKLYTLSLEGDRDCGQLMAYNYISGEHVTGFVEGRPLFVRKAESKFNLANFMRANLYTTMSVLKTGFDLLASEGVELDKLQGHGGIFKTKGVAQRYLAAAAGTPVSVMATAGEGGAWGMAILASYMANKSEGEELSDYLENRVFAGQEAFTMEPDPADVEGFNSFIKAYTKGLEVERAAVENI